MIELWIPGHIPSPNQRTTVRERISRTRQLRERARLCAHKLMLEQGVPPIQGATVRVLSKRRRLLDRHDNLPFSVKPLIDGLTTCPHKPRCRRGTCEVILLPDGDGSCRYTFEYDQELVRQPREEGVLVTIIGPAPAHLFQSSEPRIRGRIRSGPC